MRPQIDHGPWLTCPDVGAMTLGFSSATPCAAAAEYRTAGEPWRKLFQSESGQIVRAEKRHIFKGVSPNVDFYSGFVYQMLGIPVELYTPLFAIARIVGWSAHRIEELIGQGKIIRPAYKSVMKELD